MIGTSYSFLKLFVIPAKAGRSRAADRRLMGPRFRRDDERPCVFSVRPTHLRPSKIDLPHRRHSVALAVEQPARADFAADKGAADVQGHAALIDQRGPGEIHIARDPRAGQVHHPLSREARAEQDVLAHLTRLLEGQRRPHAVRALVGDLRSERAIRKLPIVEWARLTPQSMVAS